MNTARDEHNLIWCCHVFVWVIRWWSGIIMQQSSLSENSKPVQEISLESSWWESSNHSINSWLFLPNKLINALATEHNFWIVDRWHDSKFQVKTYHRFLRGGELAWWCSLGVKHINTAGTNLLHNVTPQFWEEWWVIAQGLHPHGVNQPNARHLNYVC